MERRGPPINSLTRRLSKWVFAGCLLLPFAARSASAGPPFQTDDPDPVPYGHFEAYVFELSDGIRDGGTALEFPAAEFNWGAAPNLQLHVVAPLLADFAPFGAPANFGVSDIELGAKYRFVKETDRCPEIGTFPFIELPSGDASRGLGVGRTWYRVPLWLEKNWGPWTSFGGGGVVLAQAPGYINYGFAGWLLQRTITDKLTLGAEIFGHGAEGSAATSARASTLADFGGYYAIHDGFQLLFAGGHSFIGQGELYTYLALYWTWGGSSQRDGGASAVYSLPMKNPDALPL